MLVESLNLQCFSDRQIESRSKSRIGSDSSKFGLSFGECKDCNEEVNMYDDVGDNCKKTCLSNVDVSQNVAQHLSDGRCHECESGVFGTEKDSPETDETTSHQMDEIPRISQHDQISLDESHREKSPCATSQFKNEHFETYPITTHSTKSSQQQKCEPHLRRRHETDQFPHESFPEHEQVDNQTKNNSSRDIFPSIEFPKTPNGIGDGVELILDQDKINILRSCPSRESEADHEKKHEDLSTRRCDNVSNFSGSDSEVWEDIQLTIKALRLQEDLRKQEMEELAFEAERAAEAGDKKFVGEATEFTLIGSANNNVRNPDDVSQFASQSDSVSRRSSSNFSRRSAELDKGNTTLPFCSISAGFSDSSHLNLPSPTLVESNTTYETSSLDRTPPRSRKRRSSFSVFNQNSMSMMPVCETLQFNDHVPDTYSPSRTQPFLDTKFSSIPILRVSDNEIKHERVGVMARRNIVEVIPTFEGMHQYVQMHFSRFNVDPWILSSNSQKLLTDENKDILLYEKVSTSPNDITHNLSSDTDLRTVKTFNPLRSLSNLSNLVFPSSELNGTIEENLEVQHTPIHHIPSSNISHNSTQNPNVVDCSSMIACGAANTNFEEIVYSISREDWVSPTEALENNYSDQQETVLVQNGDHCSDVHDDFVYMSILVSEINDPVQKGIHSSSPFPSSPYVDGEDDEIEINTQRHHNEPMTPILTWTRLRQTFKYLVPPSPMKNVLSLPPLTRGLTDSSETFKPHGLDSSCSAKSEEHNKNRLSEKVCVNNRPFYVEKARSDEDHSKNGENGYRSLIQPESFTEDDSGSELSVVKMQMDFRRDQSFSLAKKLHIREDSVTDSEKLDNYSDRTRVTESTAQMSDESYSSESRNATVSTNEFSQRQKINRAFIESNNLGEESPVSTEYQAKKDDNNAAPHIPRMIETEMSNQFSLIGVSDKMTMSEDAKAQLGHLCSRFKIIPDPPVDIYRENETEFRPVDLQDTSSQRTTNHNTLELRSNPDDLYINSANQNSHLLDEKINGDRRQLDSKIDLNQIMHEIIEGKGVHNDSLSLPKDDENEEKSVDAIQLITEAEDEDKEKGLNPLDMQPRSSPISDFFDHMGRLSPFGWNHKKAHALEDHTDIAFIENYFYHHVEKGSVLRAEKFVDVDGNRKLPFCEAADEKCTQMGMYGGCSDLRSVVIATAKDLLHTSKYSKRDADHHSISFDTHNVNIKHTGNQGSSNLYGENSLSKDSDNWTHYYPPRLKAKKGALEVRLDEESNCSLSLSSRNSYDYEWWEGMQGQESRVYDSIGMRSKSIPSSTEQLNLKKGFNQNIDSAHFNTGISKNKYQHLPFDSVLSLSDDEMEKETLQFTHGKT